jgi:hypothetical protein
MFIHLLLVYRILHRYICLRVSRGHACATLHDISLCGVYGYVWVCITRVWHVFVTTLTHVLTPSNIPPSPQTHTNQRCKWKNVLTTTMHRRSRRTTYDYASSRCCASIATVSPTTPANATCARSFPQLTHVYNTHSHPPTHTHTHPHTHTLSQSL